MALPDYTVEVVAEDASPLPHYRVAVVAEDASPRPDFIFDEVEGDALPDFRVAVVAEDATPLPDFRVFGLGTNDFRVTMPAGSVYSRTGVATGLANAGVVQTFAADAPQRTNRGLALEPAGTNLFVRSQEFDNASWVKARATVTANATTAPDGTLTADKIVEDATAANTHNLTQIATLADNTTYLFSAAMAPSERTWGHLRVLNKAGTDMTAYINLATGAVGIVSGGLTVTTPIQLANGFWQWGVSFTSGAGATTPLMIFGPAAGNGLRSYNGDGASGIFAWGADLKAESVLSSYVPTTTAAAARGLPVFTETVPAGHTRALLTYADASTTLVEGLTPGGTFDVATAVIGASKGRYAASEIVSRAWQL